MAVANFILFEEDFDLPSDLLVPVSVASGAIPEPEQEVWDADRAYAEGLREGREQKAAEQNEAMLTLLSNCESALRATSQEALRSAGEVADAAGDLMVRMLVTLLPASCARMGSVEVAAFAREILPNVLREPAATIHLNPLQLAAFTEVLEQIPQDARHNMTIAPSETVAPGDIRIAWADGNAARSTATAWQAMADVLEQYGLLTASDLPKAQFLAWVHQGSETCLMK